MCIRDRPTAERPFVFCPRGGFVEPDAAYEVCVKAKLGAGEHAGEIVTSDVLQVRTGAMPRVELARAAPPLPRDAAERRARECPDL